MQGGSTEYKLMVGTKMPYKGKIKKVKQNGKVEKNKFRLVAKGIWQVEGCTTRRRSTLPPQRHRESGYFGDGGGYELRAAPLRCGAGIFGSECL